MKFSQKKFVNWRFWKAQFFWVGHFGFFSFKKNFFCLIPIKSVINYVIEWILMFSLVSSKFLAMRNITLYRCIIWIFLDNLCAFFINRFQIDLDASSILLAGNLFAMKRFDLLLFNLFSLLLLVIIQLYNVIVRPYLIFMI